MSPLLGIFAAPTATTALALIGDAAEGASTPFAALLEAATHGHDRSTSDAGSQPAGDETDGLIDIAGMFAALGF